jgi:hypothetical protein
MKKSLNVTKGKDFFSKLGYDKIISVYVSCVGK